eukprot:TRINITY_DN1144_c0_g1_i1.p1 TRINITY_DN1144_c0_g1~~TRINITY_DN1144_c0_g1_i1.p1  ORF type:complete len:120 (+),score=22.31 TRINITY_DN1144_c0_g1_i1:188-547(+)
MGLLAVYQVAHTIVWLRLSGILFPSIRIRCLMVLFQVGMVGLYLIGPCLSAGAVYFWLQTEESVYEWWAVGFLFVHYVVLACELAVEFEPPGGKFEMIACDDDCNAFSVELVPTYMEMD